MSIKINNDNYDTYKKVFIIIVSRQWEEVKEMLPESVSPASVMESFELRSKSIAKKALQAGLNDTLSNLKHYPKETLAEFDAALKKENLPDLKILLDAVTKTIGKILRAKKIGNIDQYYIVKEILDDTISEISREDRTNLEKYFVDFELKATNQ